MNQHILQLDVKQVEKIIDCQIYHRKFNACSFDLPRELRDHIYAYVLATEDAPPESPEAVVDRGDGTGKSPIDHSNLGLYERDLGIYYDRKPLRYTCAGLLYSNRQVSAEMEDSIMHKSQIRGQAGVNYKIDCMVYRNQVWPTWTSLPVPPKYVHNIDVDVRMFGGGRRPFIGDGGLTPVAFRLLRLMGQFFQHGPEFVDRGQLRHPIHVDALTFTFVGLEKEVRDGIAYWTDLYHATALGQMTLTNMLVESGLLFGRVRLVRVCTMDEVREFKIEERQCVDLIAAQWASYGWIPIHSPGKTNTRN